MLIFNVLYTLICLSVAYYVYSKFIVKGDVESKKNLVYELRYRLCILAMKGEMDDKSEEYKYLMGQFNLAIKSFESDTSITNFIKCISKEASPSSKRMFKKALNHAQKNDELRLILEKYYSIMSDKIKKDVRFAIFMMQTVVYILGVFTFIVETFTSTKKYETASRVVFKDRIQGVKNYEENIVGAALKKLLYIKQAPLAA